jgi:site-specific recombinase XerD
MRRTLPKLRRHKPSGLGVVTLSGKDHYLGQWPANRKTPPDEVQQAYDRAICEWLAAGLPAIPTRPTPTAVVPVVERPLLPHVVTVAEVLAAWVQHAEKRYGDRAELQNYKTPLRVMRRLFADLPAKDFGPLKLDAVREYMINAGLVRKSINGHVGRICRVFRFAVEKELIPAAVFDALDKVKGLAKGFTDAPEGAGVRPVDDALVDATLPHLPPPVRAIVQVLRLSGARVGEVVRMTPALIDRSGAVWVYRPDGHKTAHHGHGRAVMIGPKAQSILLPLLAGLGPDDPVFSPRRFHLQRHAERTARRKTRATSANVRRNQRKRKQKPVRIPGEMYTPAAVARAVERANLLRGPEKFVKRWVAGGTRRETAAEYRERLGAEGLAGLKEWKKTQHWHVHQLRHRFGTEARKQYGIEASRTLLGHASLKATEIYAQRDEDLAARIAAEIG